MWIFLGGLLAAACLHVIAVALNSKTLSRNPPARNIPPGEHPLPLPIGVKTTEQWDAMRLNQIFNQTFVDQEVILDRCEYVRCNFKNVTFVYEGTGRTALIDVLIDRDIPSRLQTTNPAIQTWSEIQRGLGMIQAPTRRSPLPPSNP
jgi:hypothetical protein